MASTRRLIRSEPRGRPGRARAVSKMLADAEWSGWSNVAIAKACGVSDMTIARTRAGSHFNKWKSHPHLCQPPRLRRHD